MRSRRNEPRRVTWSVVNADAAADLKDLSTTLESIEAVTDLPALRAEIAEQVGQLRADITIERAHGSSEVVDLPALSLRGVRRA